MHSTHPIEIPTRTHFLMECLMKEAATLSVSVSQEWSEEESDEDDSQQPLSREDSGIQVDRTPQEDQADKNVSVTWTGKIAT